MNSGFFYCSESEDLRKTTTVCFLHPSIRELDKLIQEIENVQRALKRYTALKGDTPFFRKLGSVARDTILGGIAHIFLYYLVARFFYHKKHIDPLMPSLFVFLFAFILGKLSYIHPYSSIHYLRRLYNTRQSLSFDHEEEKSIRLEEKEKKQIITVADRILTSTRPDETVFYMHRQGDPSRLPDCSDISARKVFSELKNCQVDSGIILNRFTSAKHFFSHKKNHQIGFFKSLHEISQSEPVSCLPEELYRLIYSYLY